MLSPVRSLAAAAALLGGAVLSPAAFASPVPQGTEAVPARAPVMVAGLWCGAGLLHSYALEIAQEYQRVEARLTKRGRVHVLTGHMEGPLLRADPQRDHTMDLLAQGNELRIVAASGLLALAKGQFFTRAVGGSCTH
ncbi:MAG TPA: hypothetical protein VFM98_18480 [Ramlibacter sp.]|uniref:hypothetical protein n=1 Tax=Ramlibacter sp. TaxID=1917967 RepID=UPI002D809A2F|nr:hypothetical protein [Ramlibacter sp.]HET8747592.1 hypothetical protein [Ramlibacter sp.]